MRIDSAFSGPTFEISEVFHVSRKISCFERNKRHVVKAELFLVFDARNLSPNLRSIPILVIKLITFTTKRFTSPLDREDDLSKRIDSGRRASVRKENWNKSVDLITCRLHVCDLLENWVWPSFGIAEMISTRQADRQEEREKETSKKREKDSLPGEDRLLNESATKADRMR